MLNSLQNLHIFYLFSLFSLIYNRTLSVMPTAYLVPVIVLLGLGFLLSLLDLRICGFCRRQDSPETTYSPE
jgi:hypothetical protein